MARSTAGDREAFRELVEGHHAYAFSLAFRMLCAGDEAQEVVQESFIRVWIHRAEFHPDMKFTTWLYRIVTNLCYDLLRARRRRERVFLRMGDDADAYGGADNRDPEEAAGNRDLAGRILLLAKNLPEKQRMVFTLRDLQDQTIEEVAAIVGISPASVRTNLCYARAAIRTKLQEMNRG